MSLNKQEKVLISLILFISLSIFYYYLNLNLRVNYGDESGYIEISNLILKNGLSNVEMPLRTYVYPLLIAFFEIFTNNIIKVKFLFSIFQYVIFVYTIISIANLFYKNVFKNKLYWFFIFIFGVLNPYLIQATTLLLTDILAACCLVIALNLIIKGDLTNHRVAIVSVGLAFISVMIRPSCLIFLPLYGGLIMYKFHINKYQNFMKFIVISTLLLIVFVPQLVNNIKFFNHWTPLIHSNLYSLQSNLAAHSFKYTTVVIPGENAAVHFLSPFNIPKDTNMFGLITTNFFYFIFTYLTHIFGVLDWGYIDTYVKEYYPLSRIFGSIFMYISWYLIIKGIYYFYQNNKENRFVFLSLLFSAITYTLFIASTNVESRYGYPIWIILLPFLGLAIKSIHVNISNKILMKERKVSTFIYIEVFKILFVILIAFILSFILDSQTNQIDWFKHFKI